MEKICCVKKVIRQLTQYLIYAHTHSHIYIYICVCINTYIYLFPYKYIVLLTSRLYYFLLLRHSGFYLQSRSFSLNQKGANYSSDNCKHKTIKLNRSNCKIKWKNNFITFLLLQFLCLAISNFSHIMAYFILSVKKVIISTKSFFYSKGIEGRELKLVSSLSAFVY